MTFFPESRKSLTMRVTTIILAMIPLLASCGMHYNINGKVIDAKTEDPIEGAVVAIKWIRYKLAPPGYPTPKERYGTTEYITDSKGNFIIPKYPFGTSFMGVYKKGYICWSSDTNFNPNGRNEDEMFEHKRINIEDGMRILIKEKHIPFPYIKHAGFVQMVNTKLSWPIPIFSKFTEDEYEIYRNFIRNQTVREKK
jgi:hypothetical protein